MKNINIEELISHHPFGVNILKCPECGYDFAHIKALHELNYCKEESSGRDYYFKQGGYAIEFEGECGHNWTLVLGEHKGQIFVRAVFDDHDNKISEVFRYKTTGLQKSSVPNKKSFSYPALDTYKIKSLMIKLQLNYRDLAKLSGITESALRGILDYERKPHTSTMGKIAKGLQVDLTEIIKEWEE